MSDIAEQVLRMVFAFDVGDSRRERVRELAQSIAQLGSDLSAAQSREAVLVDALRRVRDWRDQKWNALGDRPPSPPAALLAVDVDASSAASALLEVVQAARRAPRTRELEDALTKLDATLGYE